ncbi:MAG: tryptophan synthase subunit alpha [Candidatus Zixiibacteriota bacterium]|nr:MAG: tryptophan synthase subunit alpha [candidate division Zixibacteria bacterium]
MSRIRQTLAGRGKHKLLVPFLTVGYPDFDTSIDLVRTAIDSGADIVELGMPFSDPMADGPQIQYSSQIALANGTDMKKVLQAVEQIRAGSGVPIVLMGYFNPVWARGVEAFAAASHRAGADGFIIPDLPVEEAADFLLCLKDLDLSAIFLVAPTSSPERVQLVDSACTDFVYAVTVAGVTGAARKFSSSTDAYLKGLSRSLSRPFVAGFGVSSPESAVRLCRHADGVVIGSALISAFRQAKNRREGLKSVRCLLSDIRKALP